MGARPARAARGRRRRLRHRRDDGQLHRPGGGPPAGARPTSGWDVDRDGLAGAPRVRVLVGAERHETRRPRAALPRARRADGRRRRRAGAARRRTTLERALAAGDGPDDRLPAGRQPALGRVRPDGRGDRRRARARRVGPRRRRLRALGGGVACGCADCSPGYERADSWATDAHKTLNVPYDCGLAIVARPEPLRRAFGMHAELLRRRSRARATRWRRCPSCPAAPAASRCGRCCGRSAAAASRTWSTGWWRRARPIADGIARDRRRRDPQRRRVHPGLRLVRVRRAHPRGHRAAAGRRRDLDVRVAVAGPRRAAGLGEQLVDRRRGRRPVGRRRAPRGVLIVAAQSRYAVGGPQVHRREGAQRSPPLGQAGDLRRGSRRRARGAARGRRRASRRGRRARAGRGSPRSTDRSRAGRAGASRTSGGPA